MTEYRLSEAAKQDMADIALYGDENFGPAQSNRYIDELESHFSSLAAYPKLYPEVIWIRSGYRRSVCGSHSVYYRIVNNQVEVMRILRGQDPMVALQ